MDDGGDDLASECSVSVMSVVMVVNKRFPRGVAPSLQFSSSVSGNRHNMKEPKIGCSQTTPSFTELLKPLATQPLSKTTSIPYNFGEKNGKWDFTPANANF